MYYKLCVSRNNQQSCWKDFYKVEFYILNMLAIDSSAKNMSLNLFLIYLVQFLFTVVGDKSNGEHFKLWAVAKPVNTKCSA